MHSEILSKEQVELLPWIRQFRREFYLVGGTAIAFYLGHRRSVDFDMFKIGNLNHKKNLERIRATGFEYEVTRRVTEQMNCIINNVKVTFFQYPFEITAKQDVEGVFRVPALLDLAAMKAYALGRRSKWKDYVDLYFLLKNHFDISQISKRASGIFGELFSEKMFRVQLSYFADVDYTEQVDYMIENPPTNEQIQEELIRLSTESI
ncbi:MAG: nucleotidyl transferase AbiEii/AbiGii toxin family protein [Bacteroidia bacterium]|nr:nucleotidyl transferase AbiEii/AbiGii toxin family protein [Bacteroidia bacterium]